MVFKPNTRRCLPGRMVDCCTNPLQIHHPTNQLALMVTCAQPFIHLVVRGPGPNQFLSALNAVSCYDNVRVINHSDLLFEETFRKKRKCSIDLLMKQVPICFSTRTIQLIGTPGVMRHLKLRDAWIGPSFFLLGIPPVTGVT